MRILVACGKMVWRKRFFDHMRKCKVCSRVKWALDYKQERKGGERVCPK